jgi:hypothetical protein
MITVVALSFLFSFGNVWALGITLGVPPYIAPLIAPAVDLTVIGCLLGAHELSRQNATRQQIRPVRRLLIFASTVTLALNIAEPLITGHYGKAAFDSVGCLLLIGWAEIGADLLHTIHADEQHPNPTADSPPRGPRAVHQSAPRTRPAKATEAGPQESALPLGSKEARDQDLLHRARAEDVLHWQHHQRPISADTLRKHLHIGTTTARRLVTQLRNDTHTNLHHQGPIPPVSP